MPIRNRESILPDREYILALEEELRWLRDAVEALQLDVIDARR